MSDAAGRIVLQLWSDDHVRRDDGLSYQDDLEQLTFQLFLKMTDVRARLDGEEQAIPDGHRWAELAAPQMAGVELIGEENGSKRAAVGAAAGATSRASRCKFLPLKPVVPLPVARHPQGKWSLARRLDRGGPCLPDRRKVKGSTLGPWRT